jgi:predicted RNA-binding protein with PUA-like domain
VAYWLLKSEPYVFSIEDLRRAKRTGWEGVRNYEARNNLRKMKAGDRALYFHSSVQPAEIVGVAKVVKEAYPDPSQFDPKSDYFDPKSTKEAPRWFQVDIEFERSFPRPLTVEEARKTPQLSQMSLIKRGRLSVHPVLPAEWDAVLARCG